MFSDTIITNNGLQITNYGLSVEFGPHYYQSYNEGMLQRDRWHMAYLNLTRLYALLIGLGAFLLYAFTAAPTITEFYDDSLEFQLVAPTFGIAHPTGYPLYTLLGGIWSRLLFPFGNWAWRMNLFSALAGAAAVAIVFVLARRLSRGNPWAGIVAAISFAFSPVWWSQTTIAEVYALHGLFVAAILYVATGLDDGRPTSDDGRQATRHATRNTQYAARNTFHVSRFTHHVSRLTFHKLQITDYALLFLLIGLSLTHHRTTVLLLPGIALYLLWIRPGIWRPGRAWIVWGAALLLPLLLYAYIPIRAAMGARDLEGHYANTWQGFWNHVLARLYTEFLTENPLAMAWTYTDWLELFRTQFGWVGLALGVVGLSVGIISRRDRPQWTLILFTLAANLFFAMNYQVADVEVFAIPAFLCFTLGIGHSVDASGRFMLRRPLGIYYTERHLRSLQVTILLVVAFLPLGRGPAVDRSDDWRVHNYAVAMAKVDFSPGSVVVGLRGQMTALEYMQRAEGLGRQATPVAIDNPAERRAFVEQRVPTGTPLYLTQELDGAEERYSFSGEGPLVRVWPRGQAEVGEPAAPVDQTVVDGLLDLHGYDLHLLEQPDRLALEVAFYWEPLQSIERTWKLSLRMLDGEGRILLQGDWFPLRQVAHTQHWLPGEMIRDVYTLPMVEGGRQLLGILYDAETIEEVGRFTLDLPTY
jgi:hypothetical protein